MIYRKVIYKNKSLCEAAGDFGTTTAITKNTASAAESETPPVRCEKCARRIKDAGIIWIKVENG